MTTANLLKMKSFLLVLSLTVMAGSCKKEKTHSNNCSVNMNNISGTYKLTALKYKLTASSPEQDYLALLDVCERDDLINLKNNGQYVYTDAGITCTPNESDNGTWSLAGNVLTSDGIVSGTVTSFDCHTLTVVNSGLNAPGDQLTFVMTKQ